MRALGAGRWVILPRVAWPPASPHSVFPQRPVPVEGREHSGSACSRSHRDRTRRSGTPTILSERTEAIATPTAPPLPELRSSLEAMQPRDSWHLRGQRRGACILASVQRRPDMSWSLQETSSTDESRRRTFHNAEALAAQLDSLDGLSSLTGPTNRALEHERLIALLGKLRAGESLDLDGGHGIEHAMLTVSRDGGTWRVALDLDDGDDLESLRASFSSPEDAAAWLTQRVDHWVV